MENLNLGMIALAILFLLVGVICIPYSVIKGIYRLVKEIGILGTIIEAGTWLFLTLQVVGCFLIFTYLLGFIVKVGIRIFISI